MLFEITRLQKVQLDQHQRFMQCAAVNSKVRYWLTMLPADAMLAEYRQPKLRLKAAETHKTAIDRIRGEIAALRSETIQIAQAAPTVEEMKAAAAEYVKKLAERGTPRLAIQHGIFELRFGSDSIHTPLPDIACIIAWVDPASLLKRLEAQIDEMPKPKLALTAKQKSDRLATIKPQLLALEREEESLIVAADKEGQTILRREESDPLAILGITIAAAKADAA